MPAEKSNKIFIISGPSGVGKTSIAKGVLKRLTFLKTSVTYTTRTQRLGKKEDKMVIHISENEFRKKITNGDFLEWAVVHENLYGTDKKVVEKKLKKNSLLMNIDVQGALQIKNKIPEKTVLIFLRTKTIADLARRLKKRGKMPAAIINLRLENARKELALAKKYNYIVYNNEGKLRETINRVVEIIAKN